MVKQDENTVDKAKIRLEVLDFQKNIGKLKEIKSPS
jgi:hypothetical protein